MNPPSLKQQLIIQLMLVNNIDKKKKQKFNTKICETFRNGKVGRVMWATEKKHMIGCLQPTGPSRITHSSCEPNTYINRFCIINIRNYNILKIIHDIQIRFN